MGAAGTFTRRRVFRATVLVAVLTAGYFIWTLLPTTVRVRGTDPRIVIGSVYSGPAIGIVGQLAYHDGCLYMISIHAMDREPMGHLDVAWPRSARPIVIDGVPGVQVGDEVILLGDFFMGGPNGGTPRPTSEPPPICDPRSNGRAVFNNARNLSPEFDALGQG